MEQEIWKQVKGYEGLYEISNLGRFKSCARRIERKHRPTTVKEKISTPNYNTKSLYVTVSFSKNNKTINKTLHSVLAIAFIPNPDNKPCINHIDGNKKNNNLNNLEWVTYQENAIHALDTGLSRLVLGEESSNSKLTEKEVMEIFNNTVDGYSVICKRYNIASAQYYHIKSGYAWSVVTGKEYVGKLKQSKRLKNYLKNLQK